MRAKSIEKIIADAHAELQNIFMYVESNAEISTAYEMELNIFKMIRKIGLMLMQAYFASKGTGDIGPDLKLDSGETLKKESRLLGRSYFSIFGKFQIFRTCYRLAGKYGVMPLDIQADLPVRCYSYFLQELVDFFTIRDSHAECKKTLKHVFDIDLSVSCIEVISQESSTGYDEFYENKPLPSAETEGSIQVVSFDGKGVPIIKRELAELKARLGPGEKRQKKKEALVGVSYTVDENVRSAEDVALNLIYPEKARENNKPVNSGNAKAQNVRRMASLKRPKHEVIDEIIADARCRDHGNNRPWVVLMDGALNLWSLISKKLSDITYIGILDIIHVTEYLWLAGNAIHGKKKSKTDEWVYSQLLRLLKGEVDGVINDLEQEIADGKLSKGRTKALITAHRYFSNHRQWMKYDEYLSSGYPIGTGVVESSCGHTVKKRMEGSGRRWSVEGAEAMLILRSIYTSCDWEEFWKAHMRRKRKLMNERAFDTIGYPDDYCEDDLYLNELNGIAA